MRRFLALFVIFAFFTATALAAGDGGDKDKAKKPALPGNQIQMPFLIAPLSQDGKLLGFAYIASIMVASSPEAALIVREKLAFIQDAFVRDVYGASIGSAVDPKQVDKVLLNDRLVAAAKRIAGNKAVVKMIIIAVKFAPLHPGQVPAPPPGAANAAGDASVGGAQEQENGQNPAQTGEGAGSGAPATKDSPH